jgi:hypothetical protein
MRIDKNCGSIFSNDFHAFLRARRVFSLLLKKETVKAEIAIT